MHWVGAATAYFFPLQYFVRLRGALRSAYHLFVCLHHGQPISVGLLIECNGILQYHLGGTRNDMLKLGSIKLLFDEVCLWATACGLRVLHLGGGVMPRPDDSPLHFKRGFSDRSHDFRVWRWVLAPAAYEPLCRAKTQWNRRQDLLATNPAYFPGYRCPTTPVAIPAISDPA